MTTATRTIDRDAPENEKGLRPRLSVWRRLSVTTWLAVAFMAGAMVYTQSGAGVHWWKSPNHSTYEIENFGFPFIGVMQCWMTELMADDYEPRVEVWDWYPLSLVIDVPLGLLMIGSTGVVVERLMRSRGQASLAGILALTATIAALVAIWLNAPAILAILRSGPAYKLQFNDRVYHDMPKWLLATWTLGIVCTIDTLVLMAWKIVARATRLAAKKRAEAEVPNAERNA